MNAAGPSSRAMALAMQFAAHARTGQGRRTGVLGSLVRRSSSGATRDQATDGAAATSSPSPDARLALYEERLQSDAYFRMLGTPLRRCAVTSAMLPKAVMFQLAPHIPKALRHQQPDALAEAFASELGVVRSRLTRPRRARWIRRETKVSLRKTLQRRARMLQHQVATSTTDESRQRFTVLLAGVQKQIQATHAPPPSHRSIRWLPYGLLRTDKRAPPLPSQAAADHDDAAPPMVRSGKGSWCILRSDVAAVKCAPRGPALYTWPLDTPLRVSEQLEWRVLQEARRLVGSAKRRLARLQTTRNDAAAAVDIARWQVSWLVRRMRGEEVRAYVESKGNAVVLRDEEPVRLAAVLQLRAEDKQGVAGERAEEAGAAPTYNIEELLTNDEIRKNVLGALREVATVVRQTAKIHKRRFGAADKRGETNHQTASRPAQDAESQSWPRLMAVRQDPLTVDLCIALFRLNMWRSSQKDDRVDVADRAEEAAITKNKAKESAATHT